MNHFRATLLGACSNQIFSSFSVKRALSSKQRPIRLDLTIGTSKLRYDILGAEVYKNMEERKEGDILELKGFDHRTRIISPT
jgi:hypothetical protein